LEPLLQRFPVILLEHVFYDYRVVSFTTLAALLGLGFPFLWDLDKSRR
jgi:hypothetical protein